MVFKFFAEAAARREETAAQEEARFLVTRIDAYFAKIYFHTKTSGTVRQVYVRTKHQCAIFEL